MKTLNEFGYGNISPFEQCTRGDKRFAELLKLVNFLLPTGEDEDS